MKNSLKLLAAVVLVAFAATAGAAQVLSTSYGPYTMAMNTQTAPVTLPDGGIPGIPLAVQNGGSVVGRPDIVFPGNPVTFATVCVQSLKLPDAGFDGLYATGQLDAWRYLAAAGAWVRDYPLDQKMIGLDGGGPAGDETDALLQSSTCFENIAIDSPGSAFPDGGVDRLAFQMDTMATLSGQTNGKVFTQGYLAPSLLNAGP